MKYTKMRYLVGAFVLLLTLSLATTTNAQTTTGTSTYSTTTQTTNNTTIIYVPASTMAGINNILQGRDLSVGKSGSDVAFLQGLLIELGYLNVPPGIPLGYFGGLTRAALATYQASVDVPNTGYFGPLTKQAMTAHFATQNWLKSLFPGFY